MNSEHYEVWRIEWRDGAWNTPDGRWHRGIPGSQPDIAQAHEAVDAWAERAGLVEILPKVGVHSVWWTLRFCLVHEYLSLALPHLRTLFRVMAETPFHARRLEAGAEVPEWLSALPLALGLVDEVHRVKAHRDWRRAAARVLKAIVGEIRLRRALASRTKRKRVLAVSRANAWNGTEDRELCTALEALGAQGDDLLVMEQSHGPLAAQLQGWRTRPTSHLLGDFIHLRYALATKPGVPTSAIPQTPMLLEGIDLSMLAKEFVERHEVAHFHQHNTYLEIMPRLLSSLNISAVLMTDENGAEHGLKLAALSAGIPVVAVQHGCIHANHLSYVFPPSISAEAIPLPTMTCTYGEHEKDLLTTSSVYPEQAVRVTGQVANDRRVSERRAWGVRSDRGQQLRDEILPKCTRILLLLTSQDLLHELAAERLLPLLKRSSDEIYLVVRPHPREDSTHWPRYFERHGVSQRAQLCSEGTLEDWLDACDLHVSVSSTALAEAIVWGRPNLVIGLDVVGDWLGVCEAQLATPIDTDTDLYAVAHAWDQKSRTEIESQRAHYLTRHFHQLDGLAGSRIASVVSDYLR